jgi:hypothetical protein
MSLNKLLLIDNRLPDIHIITNSLQTTTSYIIIDYNNDTFDSILNCVSNLGIQKFESVAYMAHSYYNPLYKMLCSQQTTATLFNVEQSDPELLTWDEIKIFWYNLILNYSIKNIDYLGCAMLSNSNWSYVLGEFDKIDSGVKFRASNNNTGNEDGADWILETDGSNVKELYFTEGILEWNHSLLWFSDGYYNKSYQKPFKTISGSVITWGSSVDGGNSFSIASNISSNVTVVYSIVDVFAALKIDGSVVTWGDPNRGNISHITSQLSSNVVAIYSTSRAFAALKTNGSVITWGDQSYGSNSSSVASNLSSNVISIYSTGYAFAALKSDGSVVTWGDQSYGGNSSSVASNLSSNVVVIYSTGYAFAALKSDGSVVTWGDQSYGGNSSSVASNLSSNVVVIYSTTFAFAALKLDGSVITWGLSTSGGNSSSVASDLSSNVIEIYSTINAFAALKLDGSVVTWGLSTYGGNSANVASNLSSDVVSIYSTNYSFAAIKINGSVITWGDQFRGGNSESVSSNLSSNVVSIYSTDNAFAAIRSITTNMNDLTYLTNKDKIEMLKNKATRLKISNSFFNMTGNSSINKYMKDGITYKVINYLAPLTTDDLSANFYIPVRDGERITISETTLVKYDNRIYKDNNGILELVTNDDFGTPIIINGKRYLLYPGSIIGEYNISYINNNISNMNNNLYYYTNSSNTLKKSHKLSSTIYLNLLYKWQKICNLGNILSDISYINRSKLGIKTLNNIYKL